MRIDDRLAPLSHAGRQHLPPDQRVERRPCHPARTPSGTRRVHARAGGQGAHGAPAVTVGSSLPHPAAASPPASCPRGGGHRGRASPSRPDCKPLPPGAEHRRSRRPCHPRAISSGDQRSPADSHGHLRGGRWAGRMALTWGGGEAKTAWHARGQATEGSNACSGLLAAHECRGPL
jgi:hypothetical protein